MRLGLAVGVAVVVLAVGVFLLASQAAATSGTLSIGSATIAPGATGQVILSTNVGSPGLAAWTVDIYYDPTLVSVPTGGCVAQQGGVCNSAYSATQIRIAGASATGLTGDKVLATITFMCSATGSSTSPLQVITNVFADATVGAPAPITPVITNGSITCAQQPTSTVQPPSPTAFPTPTAVPQPTVAVRANGKIAFVSDRDGNKEIYVMNPDGSGQTNLTQNAASDYEPAWSPDGSRIAFVSERDGNPDIYVMDADGQNVRRLTPGPGSNREPAWSPDGSRIAFISNRPGRVAQLEYSLFVMSSRDGSNVTDLTANVRGEGVCACSPDWSPDGTRIAFIGITFPFLATMSSQGDDYRGPLGAESLYSQSAPDWSPDGSKILFVGNHPEGAGSDLFTISRDGSGLSPITRDHVWYSSGAYSPDGSLIVFCRATTPSEPSDIYVMRSDGTGAVRLTNSSGTNCDPDWQFMQASAAPTTTPVASPLAVPNAGSGPHAYPTPGLLTWVVAGVAGAGLAWLAAGLVGTCLSGLITSSDADASDKGASLRVYGPRMKPIGQSPLEHKHQE